jgi:hypothetical protein
LAAPHRLIAAVRCHGLIGLRMAPVDRPAHHSPPAARGFCPIFLTSM